MNAAEPIAVTGFGVEVSGLSHIEDLIAANRPLPEAQFDPAPKLGSKGLRYKDQATKLALCAVVDALKHAGLSPGDADAFDATGVVVGSNLGNIDTVCQAAQTIHAGSVEDLSPMGLPNASSNNIASTIAIRYGCRAINLTLCNGATAGIDALYLAANAIRAKRARRMLVVGVEPANEYVDALLAASQPSASGIHLRGGAACVVLESESLAASRGAKIYARIGKYTYAPPTSNGMGNLARVERAREPWQGSSHDLELALGELYGARGVFECVAACLKLQARGSDRGATALIAAGGAWGDGTSSMVLTV